MRKFWRGHEDDFAFDEFPFSVDFGKKPEFPEGGDRRRAHVHIYPRLERPLVWRSPVCRLHKMKI
jgi:hypothetical protein